MAFRRRYRRKRNPRRRRNYKRKHARVGRLAVPKGLRPAVFPFRRTYEKQIDLTQVASYPPWLTGTTDGGVAGTFIARLSDLPSYSDFLPLFTQYRINAVQVKIYSQYNVADSDTSGTANGEQIIVKWARNSLGKAIGQGDTRDVWLQKQAKKEKRLLKSSGAKPLSFFFKTRQRDLIYDNTAPANDDYIMIKPHWNSIYSSSTDFVGLDIRMDTVSGVLIPLNPNPLTIPKVTIQCTFYMQMRQVQ